MRRFQVYTKWGSHAVQRYRGQKRSPRFDSLFFFVCDVDETLVCTNGINCSGINCSARHAFFAFVIVLTLTTNVPALFTILKLAFVRIVYQVIHTGIQVQHVFGQSHGLWRGLLLDCRWFWYLHLFFCFWVRMDRIFLFLVVDHKIRVGVLALLYCCTRYVWHPRESLAHDGTNFLAVHTSTRTTIKTESTSMWQTNCSLCPLCCIRAYHMFCMPLLIVAGRMYVVWYE